MRTTALLLASAIALSPVLALAAEPYDARAYDARTLGYADDAYAYQRSGAGGEAYSYRRETSERDGGPVRGPVVRGEVNCQGYCLPPGYRIEEPVRYEDRGGGYVGEPAHYEEPRASVGEPVYRDEPARTGGPLIYDRPYAGEPAYHDEEVRTGGPLYADREDRYGARRTSYEERGGYSWGYEERGGWERRDGRDREDWGRERCRQRYDDRGRLLESCGEIRLSDSFFWGGGGVGPEYIDGGGGGGGGYAEAGAGATAFASARASVGVSIRIGGKRGHGGGKPHGGCGKCGGH
jgi:hypothetical protein